MAARSSRFISAFSANSAFQLPVLLIHQPWAAPKEVLAAAGITLGLNYPRPLVAHGNARAAALAALASMRKVRPK